ncbi:unnamed protein product [Urochloa decumbens]|uniref:Embryonic flower 1-like protein n=1 Tax=Urochloa decumbens TaxID=240449 RepID=A0ABC9D5V3_9POAL
MSSPSTAISLASSPFAPPRGPARARLAVAGAKGARPGGRRRHRRAGVRSRGQTEGVRGAVLERDVSAVRGEGRYRGPIMLQSNALAVLEAIDGAVADEIMDAGLVASRGTASTASSTASPAPGKGGTGQFWIYLTAQEIMETAAHTLGTEVVEEPRCLSTVAEPDGGPAEVECNHFSIRGYVAQNQKKDPKLCFPHIFCNQQECDEHHNNSSQLLVKMYQRWNCSNCLVRVKNSGYRTTSRTVPMQKDKDDDCSISMVKTLPYHVGSRRLFSCTQQSSRGNDGIQSTVSKSVQGCNSKYSSPSYNKAVTAVNVPATSAENNVPDTFVEKSVPATKDLQDSPNNLDVSENILNDISMDVTDLPDVPEMISSKDGNGTQSLCSPKPYEVPTQDCDRNEFSVHKSISGHKGSKQLSVHRSNQVRNQGPRRTDLKRNVGSDGKKKKGTSTDLVDISYHKFSQRKPKRKRLISELIHIKIGGSADAIEGRSSDANEVDHSKTGDICESGKSKMPLEAEKDNDTPVSNQKVCKIQSSEVKNKAKLRGVDNADDGSSLMSWLRNTYKKVRTGKRNSRHKNFDSSAVSNSNPDRLASSDMCHDSVPSVGNLGRKNVLPTTSQAHNGNENTQNESENLKQRFLSNRESMIFLKRKVLSPAISCDKNTKNSTIKGSMLRTDDLRQMESEGTVQRCLKKVSLGKCRIQNVSGLHKHNIPKNKKKRGLEVHEKQTAIDDIPMDIVELLARNQHQRQLMTDNDSLGNNHTQSSIAAVDYVEIATKDGPIDALTVLDTDFKKSSASESKRKSLQSRASSTIEAANVRMKGLHMQESSQCHAASNTEIPNSHRPEHHIPDILECTQEQQTHFNRDEEVTIACTSPIFSHHQHIAEVPIQTCSNKGEKKLMWDSFKTASRNSPASTYHFQFRSTIREDSTPIPVHEASNDYATHQPVIVAADQYTEEADIQVQPRSVPSTALTMEVGGPYNERIAGHSGFYPKEPMPATHVPRLMDSSISRGFTNYPRRQMELEIQNLGSQYGQHNQYNAPPSTSYGGQVPLTLQDLARHQVEKNLHRPLRPRPRVGVFGSLLQQDIASWSENCGTHSGHRLGVSNGTTSIDLNRKGNNEALNSGMSSAGWNALQLGSVSSAANPEHPLPRCGVTQPWTGGTGRTACPPDLLVGKDICQTNRNPADFTVISNENEYMINL